MEITFLPTNTSEIHQKYIYMWNNSYRTPTECWQKTSDFANRKKRPMYLGRAKEKRKNRDKRTGMGASLVAQRLRICLLMQGTRVRALVWEDPTCRGATRPVSHNY